MRQQLERQPGRDDEGDGEGNQHADAGIDRDRAHVRPHQAGDERHRQQRRNHGQGGENGRAADFVHRLGDHLGERLAGFQFAAAVDILDHHDGVVDQDADGENQREQRHPIEGEAPRPGSEQRCGQGQHHRHADDQRLALAQRQQHQQHHEGGGESQLADQLLRLVVGGFAVVARDRGVDAVGDDGAVQLLDALDDALGDVYRVLTRLLRNRQGHRREFALAGNLLVGRRRAGAQPDIAIGLIGTVLHPRHVGHEYRPALGNPHHQLLDVRAAGQEGAGLHQQLAVVLDQRAGRLGSVADLEGVADVLGGNTVGIHPLRVHDHPHHAVRPAQCFNFARALDPLQLDFGGMGHLPQLVGAAGDILRPQGQADDRHVVDADRLDDRLAHAEIGGDPVAMRLDSVVQAHQGLGAILAHLVLHGQHRHAGARHGVDVLDAGNKRQHLLGRRRHQAFHVLGGSAGEGNEHVRHGNVDLRLFLARRHHHGEQAEQEGDERDQRRHLRLQEAFGDTAGNAHIRR